MKQLLYVTAFVSVLFFFSCGSSSSEEKDKAENIAPVTGITQPAGKAASATDLQPVTSNLQTVPSNIQPVNTTPVTATGLNPEHGKPGHRCDIAVGAPLSSAPATTATIQQPTPSPVTATKQQPVVPQPTTIGAGLNPEHGKPGHRCDIAVGAPLNSPPSTNVVKQQPVQNPVNVAAQQPVSLPQAVPINTNPPVATGAGLNPEHGKPGHRCDIAVGALLNSAPVKQ